MITGTTEMALHARAHSWSSADTSATIVVSKEDGAAATAPQTVAEDVCARNLNTITIANPQAVLKVLPTTTPTKTVHNTDHNTDQNRPRVLPTTKPTKTDHNTDHNTDQNRPTTKPTKTDTRHTKVLEGKKGKTLAKILDEGSEVVVWSLE